MYHQSSTINAPMNARERPENDAAPKNAGVGKLTSKMMENLILKNTVSYFLNLAIINPKGMSEKLS